MDYEGLISNKRVINEEKKPKNYLEKICRTLMIGKVIYVRVYKKSLYICVNIYRSEQK